MALFDQRHRLTYAMQVGSHIPRDLGCFMLRPLRASTSQALTSKAIPHRGVESTDVLSFAGD